MRCSTQSPGPRFKSCTCYQLAEDLDDHSALHRATRPTYMNEDPLWDRCWARLHDGVTVSEAQACPPRSGRC